MVLVRGEIRYVLSATYIKSHPQGSPITEDGSQLQICTVRKKKLSPIPDAASERV